MLFIQEMLGLAVIVGTSGKKAGRIREWVLSADGRSIIGFVAEGSGWLPKKRYFLFNLINNIGPDAVFVDGEGTSSIGELKAHAVCSAKEAIGKRVFSAKGEELGILEDILFDEKEGQVCGWRLSSGLIEDIMSGRPVVAAQALVNLGEDTLILEGGHSAQIVDRLEE